MPKDINEAIEKDAVRIASASKAISEQMQGTVSAIEVSEQYTKVILAHAAAEKAYLKALNDKEGKEKAEQKRKEALIAVLISEEQKLEASKRSMEAFSDAISRGLDETTAISEAQSSYNDIIDDFIAGSEAMKDQIDEVVDEMESYSREVNEAAIGTSFLAQKQHEAKEEAEDFAGGLGKSATGAMAVGVAMVFAATKISELSDSFSDTAKEFAKFNIEARTLSKSSLIAPGGFEQIEAMRAELALTRDESLAFFEVLQDGTSSGVDSVMGLAEAAEHLHDAFGEDPTSRLQNYIDLLKEIPTLDMDLSITASMDDQTAAWFALAEKGKVSQAIELQIAGLMGGNKDELDKTIPQGEREIIQRLDRAEKIEDDIYKELSLAFPPILLQGGKLVGTAISIAAGVTGVYVSAVATKRILGNVLKESEKTVDLLGEISRGQLLSSGNRSSVDTLSGRGISRTIRGSIVEAFRESKGVFKDALKMRGMVSETGGTIGRFAATRLGVTAAGKAAAGSLASSAMASGGGVSKLGLAGLSGALKALTTQVGLSQGALGGLTTAATSGAAGMSGAAAVAGTAASVFAVAVGGIAAAVLPIYAAGKYGELAGDMMLDASKSLSDTRIGKAFDGLLTAINPVSASLYVLSGGTHSFSDSMKGAGKQLKLIGSYWAEAGNSILDWLSYDEKAENLRKKEQAEALRVYRANSDVVKSLQKTQQSALHLEKALKKIDSAANTDAVALSKMNMEISSMKLEELSQIGGSVADFGIAVRDGADAVTRGYSQQMRALKRARDTIENDAKLQPAMRAAALAKLHKAEMEAAASFIDGMMRMTGNFKNIPSVAKKELQIGIRNALVDVSASIGSGLSGSSYDKVSANFKDSLSASADVADQMAADLSRAREKVLKARENAPNVAGQVKTDLKLASDYLEKSSPEEAALSAKLKGSLDIGTDVKFKKGMEHVGEEIANEAQTMIDKLSKDLGDVNPMELVTDYESLSKAAAELGKAKAEQARRVNELFNAGMNADAYAAQDKLKADNIAYKEAQEAVAEKQKEILKLVENMGGSAALELARHRELKTSEEKLVEISKKHLSSLASERQSVEKRIAGLKLLKDSSEKAANMQKAQNDLLMLEKKSVEASVESLNDVLNSLEKMVDLSEQDPMVTQLKREGELIGQKLELARLNGQSAAEFAESLENSVSLYDTQIGIIDRAISDLELVSKGGGELGKALEAVGRSYNEAKNVSADTLSGRDISISGKDASSLFDEQISGIQKAHEKLREATSNGNKEQIKAAAEEVLAKKAIFNKTLEETKKIYKEKSGQELDLSTVENMLDSAVTYASGLAGSVEASKEKLFAKRAEVEVGKRNEIYEKLNNQIAGFDESEVQRSAQALQEAASAQADLAVALGDSVLASSAFEGSIDSVSSSVSDMLKNIAQSRAEIDNERDKGNLTAFQYATAIANLAAKEAAAKQSSYEKSVDASQKLLDANVRGFDIASESIQEQVSFLEDIGGSYEQIFELRSQEIALQSARVREEQEHVARIEEMHKNGRASELQVMEARLGLQKSQNELQKKSMTAQKDAYEKMIGYAFGAIRSSRGARRLMDNQSRFFGTGRVEAPGGMTVRGEAKTMEQQRFALESASGLSGGGLSVASRDLSRGIVGNAMQGNAFGMGGAFAGKYESAPPSGLAASTSEALVKDVREGIEHASGISPVAGASFGGVPLRSGGGVVDARRSSFEGTSEVMPPLLGGDLSKVNKVDVAVGGQVKVEFNSAMFRDAVIDIVAREIGQTGSLTSSFDQRYPAKGSI